jgi:WD40 repeat protein
VHSVAISPDGGLVAAAYRDEIVCLWDVQTGQLVKCVVGHKGGVRCVAFTPDGKGLVSGSEDGILKHWDLGPLLMCAQRTAPLRELYEVGIADAGSAVNTGSGQNNGVCVCTAEFVGHMVCSKSLHPCFLFCFQKL